MYFADSICGLPAFVSICVHICVNYNTTTAVPASAPETTAAHNTIIRSKKLLPSYFPINTGGEFRMEPVPIDIPHEPHRTIVSFVRSTACIYTPFNDKHRTPKYATILLNFFQLFHIVAHVPKRVTIAIKRFSNVCYLQRLSGSRWAQHKVLS